jgi:hypothetical protein
MLNIKSSVIKLIDKMEWNIIEENIVWMISVTYVILFSLIFYRDVW